MHCPKWLDETAREYWKAHHSLLNLAPEQEEGFAILAQTYSTWRNADDPGHKQKAFDSLYKLLKEYRLTPKTAGKTPIKADNDVFDSFR